MPTTFFAATMLGAENSRTVRAVQQVAAVTFVTLLTIVAAQISIPLPFTPVPFTFQPMVVLLGAAALGSRLGACSQLCYLAFGVLGAPVFAASPVLPDGIGRLIGPTGGYLMAYPSAAFIAGWLAERGFDRHYVTCVMAMACGLVVIFAGGVGWLAITQSLGLSAALASGFYPFVAADVIKLLAGATVMPTLWRLTGLRD